MEIKGEFLIDGSHGNLCSICSHSKKENIGFSVTTKGKDHIIAEVKSLHKLVACKACCSYFENKVNHCQLFCPEFT